LKSGKKIKAVLLALLVMVFAVCGNPAALAVEERIGANAGGGNGPADYMVKKGDCLWSVARKFKVSINSLARANGLDENSFLFEGQLLTIPEVKPAGPGTVGEAMRAAEEAAREAQLESFQFWPVTGAVSSLFGPRKGRMHQGLDIAGEEGQPVRALAAGTVVWAGERGDYGNAVIINHGNGVRSLYAHALTLEVTEGEYVEQGQIIARVGSTGRSTGPHLHLEVRYRGIPINPVNYLPCIARN